MCNRKGASDGPLSLRRDLLSTATAKCCPASNGKATADIDFGPDGYDAAKGFHVVWGSVATNGDGTVQTDGSGNPVVTEWNHTGGDMSVSASSTVVDKASGVSKNVDGQADADFTPAASGATDVAAANPAASVGAGQEVSFTVTGTFVDTDGSELHYFLVEQQPGWSGMYNTMEVDGKSYFMVPVISTQENPSVVVTLTTPSNVEADGSATLSVGVLTQDGHSSQVDLGQGASSTIDIGVVSATGVSLDMADTSEDAHTQMQFALDGGDNDAISAITLTDLHGGSIVDANGNVLFTESPAQLDVQTTLDGGYYYLPPANADGDFSVDFHAVVKDLASGASKDFSTEAGDVSVSPVTDVPDFALGSDGQPVFEAGHSAQIPVHLQAAFADMDGSEAHFFLVTLPDGASAPTNWTLVTDDTLLNAAGLSGQSVYRIEADASGAASFSIGVGENYGGGEVQFVAGSVEKANLDGGNPDYQFAPNASVSIAPTGEINLPPAAQNLTEHAGGLAGNELNGALALVDPDGDVVSIAGASVNGVAGSLNSDGSYLVKGLYGDFVVSPEGTYTYNLFDPHGSGQDVLEITLVDPYGATVVSSVSVDVVPVSGANPLAATHFGLFSLSGDLDSATASAALDPLAGDAGDVSLAALPVVHESNVTMPGVGTPEADAAFLAGGGSPMAEGVAGLDATDAAAASQSGQHDSAPDAAAQAAAITPFELDQSTGHEEEAAEVLNQIKLDFGG